MPIDNVLLRFAGTDSIDQSQSLLGRPMSQRLPSTLCLYDFDHNTYAGDYPIPGVTFVDMQPGEGTWSGYQNFTVELRISADHVTDTYVFQLFVKRPDSESVVFTHSYPSAPITLPTPFDPAEELTLCFTRNNVGYVRLRVVPADLVEGTEITYTFTVAGARRDLLPSYYPHTGAWLSQYAVTFGETDSYKAAMVEECLQLISINTTKPYVHLYHNFEGRVYCEFGTLSSSQGYLTPGGGGVQYFRYSGTDGSSAVVRYDAGRADRTITVYEGYSYSLSGISSYESWGKAVPVSRGKNTLFPPTYHGYPTFRAYYIENLINADVSVALAAPSKSPELELRLDSIVATPNTLTTIGDGVDTGIVGTTLTNSTHYLGASPTPIFVIPEGSVGGIRLGFVSSAPSMVETTTTLAVIAP